eukprot:TRINITY_DN93_c0_g1_i2.p1 TRINITY_DN93_c0_g1~~TRINITY_DN93_c0_g1_i2.p1  ORF type:complete len:217 (+),score=76.59 TRINITY_DN93_c0_g1_i2:70-720(+)
MIRRPPRSTLSSSSAASDVYKRQVQQYFEKNTEDGSADAARDEAYIGHISSEVFKLIEEVCTDVVSVYVEGEKKAEQPEVIVFFKKMEGDYNRYGAEITEGPGNKDKKEHYTNAAKAAYESALKTAEAHLPSTNPIRLGLALNFSVFHYEICEQKGDAVTLAKSAFDLSIDHLDSLPDDEYKDSTLIMQLLKDNLTLWTDNTGADEADDIQVEDVH